MNDSTKMCKIRNFFVTSIENKKNNQLLGIVNGNTFIQQLKYNPLFSQFN